MNTANPASAGADRGHSRRTVPRPKYRGQAALEEPRIGGPSLRDLRNLRCVSRRQSCMARRSGDELSWIAARHNRSPV